MQRNVDIVESRRNGPQPSMRHDDDDDDDDDDRTRGGHFPDFVKFPRLFQIIYDI